MQMVGWMILCFGVGVLAFGPMASGQHGALREEGQGSGAAQLKSVTFRVLGLMKTKSGAT